MTVRPKIIFDPDVSIIMAGLPTEDGGNILADIRQLFMDILGNETQIVDAARLSGRGGQPELEVKVECASTEEEIGIPRQKHKLKDHSRYRKVYVHSAKSHTNRLIELNFKTLRTQRNPCWERLLHRGKWSAHKSG